MSWYLQFTSKRISVLNGIPRLCEARLKSLGSQHVSKYTYSNFVSIVHIHSHLDGKLACGGDVRYYLDEVGT
jgi:hypothetical protein